MDNNPQTTEQVTNPTDVTNTEITSETKVVTPLEKSLKRFVKDVENGNGEQDKKEPEKEEEDKKEPEKKEEKTKEESDKLTLKEEFLTDIKPEELDNLKKLPVNEELKIKYIQTYNDMQKYNRLQSERDKEIQKYKKFLGENPDVAKVNEFVNLLREDPIKAFSKFKDDLELPDPDRIIGSLQVANDISSKVAEFQKKELIPKIIKKFKLADAEDFVYDPEEAYTPGTASYEFRVATEKKEKQIISELEEEEKKASELVNSIQEERQKQIIELKNTLFPELKISDNMSDKEKEAIKESNVRREQEFIDMLNHIDNMFIKLKETKSLSPDVNPFAISTIFKGVHFDKLVNKAVQEAVDKVHQEYKSKGLYLSKDEKSKPTDVNNIQKQAPSIPENGKRISPLVRSINRVINKQ